MWVQVLASQWFLTLFAYALPHGQLCRVWDMVCTDGWKMLMRVAVARLLQHEATLLPLRYQMRLVPYRALAPFVLLMKNVKVGGGVEFS
jgi:hypothetical protein